MISPVHHRDVEVRPAVIVEVAPRRALHKPQVCQTAALSHLAEGAIVIIVEKLRRMRIIRARLVPNKEVEPPITVEVRPRRRLRRVQGHQPRCLRHIVEGAIAVVAQQRHRVAPLLAPPSAAQNQNVRMSVIVVVRLYEIESSDLAQ